MKAGATPQSQQDAGIDGILNVELFPNALDHAVFDTDLCGVISIKRSTGVAM